MYIEGIIDLFKTHYVIIGFIIANIIYLIAISKLNIRNILFQTLLYFGMLIILWSFCIFNIQYLFVIAIILIAYCIFILSRGENNE